MLLGKKTHESTMEQYNYWIINNTFANYLYIFYATITQNIPKVGVSFLGFCFFVKQYNYRCTDTAGMRSSSHCSISLESSWPSIAG